MVRLGKIDLRPGEEQIVDGTTVSGQPSRGAASMWTVSGPPGVMLMIGDVKWDTGERDVRAFVIDGPLPAKLGGPRPLTRLERGGRLSVLQHGLKQYVELQISRIKADSPELWSSTHKASEEDFDLLQPDWKQALLTAGAARIGTRESIIGDESRRKSYLCAVLEPGENWVPLAAYALTRILPLLDVWSPVHEERNSLPNQMRVCSIELDSAAHRRGASKLCVYVGDTARTPGERFETHKAGGRTAARDVYRHGLGLLPHLYEHIPPVGHADFRTARKMSAAVERWLKERLEDEGYAFTGRPGASMMLPSHNLINRGAPLLYESESGSSS